MKIASIVGARPQFIKCAPVSRILRRHHEEILIHTGQHYDPEMSEVFFNELRIPEPDYNLGVGSGSHGKQTGLMLERIETVLIEEEPNIVLVFGDTNSTLAGALAAVKLQIPVAHVEAGLRSYDRRMPEEINRVVADHLASYLFCPTETSVANLQDEGIVEGVHLTGDVMVDVLREYLHVIKERSSILEQLSIASKGYLVATVHRSANTDIEQNLRSIVEAFGDIKETVVFPAHPRTIKYLKHYGLHETLTENILLIDPVPYSDMLNLMANARMILTDSGGIQKEAYILRVPCLTLRENTEWVETLEDGWNILVGADRSLIVNTGAGFKPSRETYRDRFGSGDAAEQIITLLTGN
jgi:UDP-N-acetylglucosamine 2-epimerase